MTLHPQQAAISIDACPIALSNADELQLAQRLIGFDSSHPDGIRACTDFALGWLEGHEIRARTFDLDGLPVLDAIVGEGPVTVVLHAHLDVVPGKKEQYIPHVDDEFLWGRGSYDMKGATATMFTVMADLALAHAIEPLGIRVRLLCVPDEEDDKPKDIRGTEAAVQRGLTGDFVVCGEPTDLHVGIQAKGVLDVRIDVEGRGAHGATPWLGVNAIERAMDIFDALKRLPFAQASSRFYERPSINLGRISGGDRINQVPDKCTMDVDIRFLPEQPVEQVREELMSLALPGCRVTEMFRRPPAKVSTTDPFLQLLRASAQLHAAPGTEVELVGRDGTNDGTYFLQRGIPSVEFGPTGSGHHGPKEKVTIASLRQYRLMLLSFLDAVAKQPEQLAGRVPHRPQDEHRDTPRSLA
ncbi:MAG: M20/M25/M40 family metallo-hydrolase [Thermoleophilia bacterium]|nr:M20/M25/M40 family metallo-hydrolase [Thermoleophilia bacterium]